MKTSMKPHLFSAGLSSVRRAFTLVEIIVVLTVISILVVIAVPAFTSLIASQDEAAAESRLRAGLASARDAALAGAVGEDTGALFTYGPQGPVQIVPVVRVGTINDTSTGVTVTREVFVPIDSVEPVTLPAGWTVLAWARSAAFSPAVPGDRPWYSPASGGSAGAVRYPPAQANWVFPETGFYNHTLSNDGQNRQSFMVRFQAASGQLAGESGQLAGQDGSPALVLLPRPSNEDRNSVSTDLQAHKQADFRRFAERVLRSGVLNGATASDILGAVSSDVVFTRPVQMLALTDEQGIADGIGVRLDPISRSLYSVPQGTFANLALSPQFVAAPNFATTEFASRVNRYIENYEDLQPLNNDDLVAARTGVKIFTIDRYGGSLVRVQLTGQTRGTPGVN